VFFVSLISVLYKDCKRKKGEFEDCNFGNYQEIVDFTDKDSKRGAFKILQLLFILFTQ